MNTLHEQLKNAAIRRMNESLERIHHCTNSINEEQVWHRFNSETPSVGNLVLHLSGNIRQWIISTLGGIPDQRKRDSEFNEKIRPPIKELNALIAKTIEEAIDVIEELTEDGSMSAYNVQGFNESGTDIVVHVVEHLSYHTGQIALHTKILTQNDLGFYSGQDLNSTRPTNP